MSNNIEIYKDKLYFKNIEYDYNTFNLLLNNINKKIRITISSEKIFIKKYSYPEGKIRIEKYIDNKISEDFSDKANLLFHYEVEKNKRYIYLYSMRIDRINNLFHCAKELIVEPVQFKVKNKVLKKLRKHKLILVHYKTKELNHLINIENNFIVDSLITESFEEVNTYINERSDHVLVVDKNLRDIKIEDINYYFDLGVDTHEKIC
jgi:hypothetical protein